MSREEKAATRCRAMFRRYPDALTPRQVQEMLGVGQRIAACFEMVKFRVSAWGGCTGCQR